MRINSLLNVWHIDSCKPHTQSEKYSFPMPKFLLLIGFISILYSASIHSQDYIISPLPFNKTYSNEIAPFFQDSVLYFSSNRKSSLLVTYLGSNNEYLYKTYLSQLNANGKWSDPKLAFTSIQNPFSNGPLFLNKDGKQLIITQSQSENAKSINDNKKGDLMGLFEYDKSNSNWSNPIALPFNSITDYSVGHPTLSPDGKELFFSSDMNKGYGKTDIYMCENKNGTWSEPINLGSAINTPGNEVFPFYHPSGRLYFASDGHAGQGGLDIFYSVAKGNGWSEPISLGFPVNSSFDDYGCFVSENGEWGYFTSNRDKSDNIYEFKQAFPVFLDCQPQVEDNYCFTLFENGSYKSDTLPYVYRWDFGDGHSGKGLEVDHCFPGPGAYHVALNVVDTLLKEDLYIVAQYDINLEKTEQIYISSPDTVKIGVATEFNANKTYFKTSEPDGFFWDFGDGTRLKGESLVHNFSKKGTYTIKCGTVFKGEMDKKFCTTKEITVIE